MNIPTFPAILLGLCALVCILLVLHGLRKSLERSSLDRKVQPGIYRNVLFVLLCWILLLGVLAWRGVFADFSKVPPRIGFAMLLPLPIVLRIAFSKRGRELLKQLPMHWLIYLQSFRIVVEIVLWLCVRAGATPVQMSFEGRNFDILSGLFALPVGYYCSVKKNTGWIVLLYNIAGLLLLINIAVIAVLSLPTPLRVFHNEPANTLVAYFPFIYLPGLLVPLAYTLHIFSIRQWVLARRPI